MHEKFALALRSDASLIHPYWDTVIRKDHLEPEKMLMLAVLQDGITCFQKHLRARNPKFREEEEWFLKQDCDSPFAFQSICDALGLDPNYIRRELLRWKQRTFEETMETSPPPWRRACKKA